MAEALPDHVRNLTDMADRMRLDGVARVRMLETAGLFVELLTGTAMAESHPDTTGETLYLIVSGDGVLESDGIPVIVTAGDVVFVPARAGHRFIEQSRKFRTWKINLPPFA